MRKKLTSVLLSAALLGQSLTCMPVSAVNKSKRKHKETHYGSVLAKVALGAAVVVVTTYAAYKIWESNDKHNVSVEEFNESIHKLFENSPEKVREVLNFKDFNVLTGSEYATALRKLQNALRCLQNGNQKFSARELRDAFEKAGCNLASPEACNALMAYARNTQVEINNVIKDIELNAESSIREGVWFSEEALNDFLTRFEAFVLGLPLTPNHRSILVNKIKSRVDEEIAKLAQPKALPAPERKEVPEDVQRKINEATELIAKAQKQRSEYIDAVITYLKLARFDAMMHRVNWEYPSPSQRTLEDQLTALHLKDEYTKTLDKLATEYRVLCGLSYEERNDIDKKISEFLGKLGQLDFINTVTEESIRNMFDKSGPAIAPPVPSDFVD